MLLYSNHSFWRIVFTLRGSVVYKGTNLLIGVCVAAVTLVLVMLREGEFAIVDMIEFQDSLGWNMAGGGIMFGVVFRTGLGWNRYWEAVGNLQEMYSKWMDAYSQCLAFVCVTQQTMRERPVEDAQLKVELLKKLRRRVRDRLSMLSALAAHRLSHGDMQRMNLRASKAGWNDQVILRRELRIGADLTGATLLPGFVVASRVQEVSAPTHLANHWHGSYTVLGEVTSAELRVLQNSADRVNTVIYWINHDISLLSSQLYIGAPIQSRVYQELSSGALSYNNAVKIADVPFPLLFAQLFNYLICAVTLFIPPYAAFFTSSLILSPMIAFVVHQTFYVLNHVACELETPFGSGDGDISLRDYHSRFLLGILELEWNAEFMSTDSIDAAFPQCSTLDGCLHAATVASSQRSAEFL